MWYDRSAVVQLLTWQLGAVKYKTAMVVCLLFPQGRQYFGFSLPDFLHNLQEIRFFKTFSFFQSWLKLATSKVTREGRNWTIRTDSWVEVPCFPWSEGNTRAARNLKAFSHSKGGSLCQF